VRSWGGGPAAKRLPAAILTILDRCRRRRSGSWLLLLLLLLLLLPLHR
jgi:hypothetical protein